MIYVSSACVNAYRHGVCSKDGRATKTRFTWVDKRQKRGTRLPANNNNKTKTRNITGKSSKLKEVKNLARHSFIRKIAIRNTHASKLNHFTSAVRLLVFHGITFAGNYLLTIFLRCSEHIMPGELTARKSLAVGHTKCIKAEVAESLVRPPTRQPPPSPRPAPPRVVSWEAGAN